jgi:hypothetical protein
LPYSLGDDFVEKMKLSNEKKDPEKEKKIKEQRQAMMQVAALRDLKEREKKKS